MRPEEFPKFSLYMLGISYNNIFMIISYTCLYDKHHMDIVRLYLNPYDNHTTLKKDILYRDINRMTCDNIFEYHVFCM